MGLSDLNIALIVRTVDRMTGPMKPMIAAVERFGHISEHAGRRGVDWTNKQIAANQAHRQALQGQAFGALAFGIGTSEVEHVLATQVCIYGYGVDVECDTYQSL